MQNINKKEIVTAPNLMAALISGFDSVTNHVYLLLFPLAFDLFLWLGPRLRLHDLIINTINQVETLQKQDKLYSSPDMVEMMRVTKEIWGIIAERANMFSSMRTYPVGVPSIMVGRLPLLSPLGNPSGIELNFGSFFLSWTLLIAIGLLLGTCYFALTAQATLKEERSIIEAIKDLPRAFMQVIWLTLFLTLILIVIGIPVSILFSTILIVGGSFGVWIVFALSGLLLWGLLPLIFSPHGIFVDNLKMLNSFLHGLRLAHGNLPKTGLFILLAFVISQGMDVLWQTPPEESWLSLIGIFGHAFISTGLLAASFVYYKQAEKWLQAIIQQRQATLAQQTSTNIKA